MVSLTLIWWILHQWLQVLQGLQGQEEGGQVVEAGAAHLHYSCVALLVLSNILSLF